MPQQRCYDSAYFRGTFMKHAGGSGNLFRFGLFEADPVDCPLNRNGGRVKIQDQPFRLLVLLLEHPGEVVSREELRQALWPEGTHVDFDGSLNVILKRLRAALDDDPERPRFIETVPRRGYRFIAPVAVIKKVSGAITPEKEVAGATENPILKAEHTPAVSSRLPQLFSRLRKNRR